MYGQHNVSNALAAISIALEMGMTDEQIRTSLAGFSGVKRRFTKVGEAGGISVIDDYGHHPVEISAVLSAARSACPAGRVYAVVQPHRYSRLHDLFDDFCACFNDADGVVVADVYAAGEDPIEGADRDSLVAGLRASGHRQVYPLHAPEELAGRIAELAVPGDLWIASVPETSPCGRKLSRVNWRMSSAAPVRSPERTHDHGRPRSETHKLIEHLPEVRGRYQENVDLSGSTWFQVGGPAELVFRPADAEDLAAFLRDKPAHIPVTVIGVTSNLLIRDGGIRGRILLGKGFTRIDFSADMVTAGSAVLDLNLAKAALAEARAGLAFMSGIPGSIGGGIRMNAAPMAAFKDVLFGGTATGDGILRRVPADTLGMSYRHSDARRTGYSPLLPSAHLSATGTKSRLPWRQSSAPVRPASQSASVPAAAHSPIRMASRHGN